MRFVHCPHCGETLIKKEIGDEGLIPYCAECKVPLRVPFFYEWTKAQMYRDLDETDDADIPVGHRLVYREVDAVPWGANAAYQIYQEEGYYLNWYLLCYDDKIIEIRFDWEPTAEQMAIVSQKLSR